MCATDAAFRVISVRVKPHHSTVARFVVDHRGAIEAVFADVLALCAATGLVSMGRTGIDPTKMGANAALDQNRGAERILLHEVRCKAPARQELHPSGGLARMEAALAEVGAAEAARGIAASKRDAARAAAARPPESESKSTAANISDPGSRIMNAKTGWTQSHNCQAAVNGK